MVFLATILSLVSYILFDIMLAITFYEISQGLVKFGFDFYVISTKTEPGTIVLKSKVKTTRMTL